MDNKQTTYNLPANWIWTTIGEIGIIESGSTPNRSNSTYFNGKIPWVKSGELNYNIITETEEKITENAISQSNVKVISKGAMLVALYGSTVGKVAILGVDATTNQAIASISVTGSLLNRYLYYYLISAKDHLLKLRKGGAQPNISQVIIKGFSFPLPPLEEQNRIVEMV